MYALDRLYVAMARGLDTDAPLSKRAPGSQAKCFFDFKKEYSLDLFGDRLRKVVVNADRYVMAREFDYLRALQGTGDEYNPLLHMDAWYANAVGGKALLFFPPPSTRSSQKMAL